MREKEELNGLNPWRPESVARKNEVQIFSDALRAASEFVRHLLFERQAVAFSGKGIFRDSAGFAGVLNAAVRAIAGFRVPDVNRSQLTVGGLDQIVDYESAGLWGLVRVVNGHHFRFVEIQSDASTVHFVAGGQSLFQNMIGGVVGARGI